MAVQTFTATGSKSTVSHKLPSGIFGIDVKNHELLKTAYVGYLANGRGNNAVTLRRGEVRGGGRKPWRQKGTGRARFGSSRNPIWRGGGIAFGPTGIENYSVNLSVESRRRALCQALSIKNQANSVMVIEKFSFRDPKTSDASKLLTKLGAKRNILIVVNSADQNLSRAMNNLPKVLVVTVSRLSTYHVMNADTVILASDAIVGLENRLITVGARRQKDASSANSGTSTKQTAGDKK